MEEIEKLAPKYYHDSIRIAADIYKTFKKPKFQDERSPKILLYNLEESCVEHPHTGVWSTIEDILNDLESKNWTKTAVVRWLKSLIPDNKKALTLYRKNVKVAQ